MGPYQDKFGAEINLERWGELLEDPKYRVIKQTRGNNGLVSTVWLGSPHCGKQGTDYYFETMVFRDDNTEADQEFARYRTLAEAEEGHERKVKRLILTPELPAERTVKMPEEEEAPKGYWAMALPLKKEYNKRMRENLDAIEREIEAPPMSEAVAKHFHEMLLGEPLKTQTKVTFRKYSKIPEPPTFDGMELDEEVLKIEYVDIDCTKEDMERMFGSAKEYNDNFSQGHEKKTE